LKAIPASLRLSNQRRIIERLLLSGTATRADLAKATGISQPTAGKIIDDLIQAGVVEEIAGELPRGHLDPQGSGRRLVPLGRPGRTLRLARSIPRLLALHVGVERTQLGLIPAALPVDGGWTLELPTARTSAGWVRRIKSAVEELDLSQIWAAIVSVPGVVDERAGKILLSPNLHWSERIDVPALVREVADVPVFILNEVRALALGELTRVSAETNFLLVDLGDGVGGAIVLNGWPYQGPLPLSGEIGHTPVPGGTRRCGCGGTGCLETLVSKPSVITSFEEHGGIGGWDGLVSALEKDPLPAWLKSAFDAAASGIAGAINTVGVPRVVLSGPVADLPERTVSYLTEAVEAAAMWSRFETVSCVVAPQKRLEGLVLAGIQNAVIPTDWIRHKRQPTRTR
jgi:N-acetylglucosamine repressor